MLKATGKDTTIIAKRPNETDPILVKCKKNCIHFGKGFNKCNNKCIEKAKKAKADLAEKEKNKKADDVQMFEIQMNNKTMTVSR